MLIFLLACARHTPVETPALVAAAAPITVLPLPAGNPVVLALRAGSAFDPPGREGLAWVAAHAVADPLGVTVEVGPELVLFTIPAEKVGAFAAAIGVAPGAEAVAGARVAAGVALDTLDCRALAERAWDAWMYTGHPYGHAPEGRRGVLETLTAVEVANFQEVRYTRSAAVLGVPEGTTVDPSLFSGLRTTLSASPTPSVTLDPPSARVLVVTAPDQRCAAVGQPGEIDAALVAELGGSVVDEARRQPRRLAWLPVPPDRDLAAFAGALLGPGWIEPWRTSRAIVEPVRSPLEPLVTALQGRHPWPSLDHVVPALGKAAPVGVPTTVSLESLLDPSLSHLVLVLPPDAVPPIESFGVPVVQPVVTVQELLR